MRGLSRDLSAASASSLPRLKSASCVQASHASRRIAARLLASKGCSAARATPIALDSSSSVPYASMRQALFLMRPPPTRSGRSVVAGASVDPRQLRHRRAIARRRYRSSPRRPFRRRARSGAGHVRSTPRQASSRRFLQRRPTSPHGTRRSVSRPSSSRIRRYADASCCVRTALASGRTCRSISTRASRRRVTRTPTFRS